jgi:hypothetical protein
VSRQQAQKKICLDFVHARFNASVWLQAGQYLALAAQIPAKQKSGCPRLKGPKDEGRWWQLTKGEGRMANKSAFIGFYFQCPTSRRPAFPALISVGRLCYSSAFLVP